jgi:hypothetical protein
LPINLRTQTDLKIARIIRFSIIKFIRFWKASAADFHSNVLSILKSSFAPKVRGNETAANNAPADEINRQPDQELEPTNPDNGEESRFTPKQWIECGGIVGILMIWFEILDCHDLFKLVVASLALLFLYAGLCDFISSFLKKKSGAVSLVLCVWIVLSVLTGAFVYKNSRPEEIGLPWMEIKTREGFTFQMTDDVQITGEMAQTYREQLFTIKNTNSIDLRDFSARVQLPEPAVRKTPTDMRSLAIIAPPGVNIRWVPEDMTGIALNGVYSIPGQPRPKADWQLDIDVLPAFKTIEIPFLTVQWPFATEQTLTDTNTHVLVNYVLGEFQVPNGTGWRTQEVVMAILFDRTNRVFYSLAPQNTTTNWKGTVRRYGDY